MIPPKTISRSIKLTFLAAFVLCGSALFAALGTIQVAKVKGEASGGALGFPTQNPNIYAVSLAGSGHASFLGNVTLVAQHVTNALTGTITDGSITFVTANGDQVRGGYAGQEFPSASSGIDSAIVVITVTGGTGKFAGATGSIILTATLKIDQITNEGVYIETVNAQLSGELLVIKVTKGG